MQGDSTLPPVPPVSRALCAALLATSLVATWSQRKLGLGSVQLVYHAQEIWRGQVWRLLTYPFICTDPTGLLAWCLGLWLLGGRLEQQWGSRAYLRFFALTSVVGGALGLLIQPAIDLMTPFVDLGLVEGPRAAIDGMLVAMAVSAPQGRVMVGLVLPMTTRNLLWLVLSLHVISGILRGEQTDFSVALGGALVGWLLATGRWRPDRWRRQPPARRRSAHLYAVPRTDRHLN